MSDNPTSPTDVPTDQISEKRDRIEEITERLEEGEVSLDRARELHAEGKELLESLRDDLDLEDGSVTVWE